MTLALLLCDLRVDPPGLQAGGHRRELCGHREGMEECPPKGPEWLACSSLGDHEKEMAGKHVQALGDGAQVLALEDDEQVQALEDGAGLLALEDGEQVQDLEDGEQVQDHDNGE